MIIFLAILTYILPAGEFDRIKDKDGRTIVKAGSYHSVPKNPQGVTSVLMAPIRGIMNASAVVGFVLIVGGAFGVIGATGAILYSAANVLEGLPGPLFVALMLLVQNCIGFLVPSSSGHAALTIPVLAPLGDLIGVHRQIIVTAFQYGSGLTNMITPSSGVLMGALGLSRIPWDKWVKFILPLWLVFWVLAVIFLIVGLTIYSL